MEIEEIMQYYERFIEILKQTSMNAKEQIIKLNGTAVADEIATDFSDIGMIYAHELLVNGWITNEQYQIVKEIDEELCIMSERKELWTEDALFVADEWEKCRERSRKLLSMLE